MNASLAKAARHETFNGTQGANRPESLLKVGVTIT